MKERLSVFAFRMNRRRKMMINVLIVEDDPMVGELNKRYLSQIEGFQLKGIASSFQSAAARAERASYRSHPS